MGGAGDRLIEAAGGALWRPAVGGSGVDVALVHRPKYDDWSLPKGKLHVGEHLLAAASREVTEETGFRPTLGRPLGQVRYLKDGIPKRVRYWAMRAGPGSFVAGDEVDQLIWLPPPQARRHLSPDRDRPVLAGLTADTLVTWPCALVRHGSAGERTAWSGDDHDRPLDETGHRQAAALTPLLDVLGVERVLSADVVRCLDTVAPFARAHGRTVESEPLMSETGFAGQPEAAAERLLAIMGTGTPTAVCAQGRSIPGLVERTCLALGSPPPGSTRLAKGGFWVLHLAADHAAVPPPVPPAASSLGSSGGGPAVGPARDLRLVALERFDPPA